MPFQEPGRVDGEDVLFIRLRLLGDIIFTIPAMQIFKERRPQGRIHYVAEERFLELAEIIPFIENVITVPGKPGWRDFWEFRKRAKHLGIGTAIDFHSGPTSALFTLASGAARRVGYRTVNRNWAYTDMLSRPGAGSPIHSVVNQARLLEKIGIAVNVPPPYPVLDMSRFPVFKRLEAVGAMGPKVIVHLGAGNRFRDWGMDNFTALIGGLSAKRIPVFLIGHSDLEKQRAAALSRIPHTFDFSGRLAIRELLQLIAAATVYLGADSGPLHLASLTRTPLVGFYGPNLPGISGPWRKENVEILQLEMPCRPCSQRKCKYATIHCMRNIPVEKVRDALGKFLK